MSRCSRLHVRALALLIVATLGIVRPGAAQQIGAPYTEQPGPAARYRIAADAARELVQTFMTQHGVPGLSIAVGVDGRIVWSEGFGYANLEHRIPVTRLTRFRSGSVAKALTSTAASVLYEQGKLDYDAPIQRYVPSFPDKGYPITPRQLAGHLAGLRYYPDDGWQEFFNVKHYTDVVDTLAIFQNDPLVHPPGTKYLYTTYGTNLLGAAVQGAAGKPFLDVLRELVFEPLGMSSTTGDLFDEIIPNRTAYYERPGGRPSYVQKDTSWGDGTNLGAVVNAPFADNSNKWPGGGFITNPEDLVRYGAAHLEPGYLKAETLKMHFTPMKTTSGEDTHYAMNWDIGEDDRGRPIYSKSGSSVGGKSILLLYPNEKVVVAIQHNLTNPNYGPLPRQTGDLFIQAARAPGSTSGGQ